MSIRVRFMLFGLLAAPSHESHVIVFVFFVLFPSIELIVDVSFFYYVIFLPVSRHYI